jgi:glycosyltransferase involved in cell wall biosynthesis
MKICFLTPEYPHHSTRSSGGIGTSIYNLAKGLIALGHQVTVIVFAQYEEATFEENGVTIYKLKNISFKGLSFYLTQLKIAKLINRLYSEHKIDIVEAPDWTGCTAFVNVKCPVVLRLNGSDTYFCHLDQRPVKKKNRFFEKRALKRADGIISVSKFTGDLTNEVFGIKRDFEVIPNAIDMSQFEGSSNSSDEQTILYFGTLIRKKGSLELPLIFNEVYKKNNQAKLILVGRDASDIITNNKSVWQMMQPLFDKEAFKNVTYLGSVPYSEIKNLINKASVCVFPTFAEALPVSWLEAMAMQKPIVACNIGWATEVIEDGKEGFLVHPKDHELYAAKIGTLLQDKALQVAFGKAAKDKILQKFSIEVVAKQSLAFYSNYISK